jgi:putative transposase
MPRPPRIQVAGANFHVTARGNRGQAIMASDEAKMRFLLELLDISDERGWHFHAYCVMTNHYHLLVETPKPDISAGMHRLNTRYVKWFNRRHNVSGHLFERRFHSVLIVDTVHLLEALRYIALNPVRARLCAGPASWSWSSFRATAGLAAAPPFLAVDRVLALFGGSEAHGRERYVKFVRDGIETAA